MHHIVLDTTLKTLILAAGNALNSHPEVIGSLVSTLPVEILDKHPIVRRIQKEYKAYEQDEEGLTYDALNEMEVSNNASEWALEIHQALVDVVVEARICDTECTILLLNAYEEEIALFSLI